MALRGFAGFGDAQADADRDMYADWWGQTPGQALTEQVSPEIVEAEAMFAQPANLAKPGALPIPRMATQASTQGDQLPNLAKRVIVPLLVVGGIGAILMLMTSSKKSK